MEQFVGLWQKEFQQKKTGSLSRDISRASILGFEQYLQQNFLSKGSVLDLGAGLEDYSSYLCSNGFTVSAMCCVQEKMQTMQYSDSSTKICCCDSSLNFPFSDEAFDYVIDVCCYRHLLDEKIQTKYVSELKRVLKKGGLYFLSLSGVDDGYYGPLLASSLNPHLRVVVDPHTGVSSRLYCKEEIEKKFPGLSLLEFSEKKSMGLIHKKLYSRSVLTFLFEAFLVL